MPAKVAMPLTKRNSARFHRIYKTVDIFIKLVDIKSVGCSLVVRILLPDHSRKVIKISALLLKEDFDIYYR